jgi:hypothetical protein
MSKFWVSPLQRGNVLHTWTWEVAVVMAAGQPAVAGAVAED